MAYALAEYSESLGVTDRETVNEEATDSLTVTAAETSHEPVSFLETVPLLLPVPLFYNNHTALIFIMSELHRAYIKYKGQQAGVIASATSAGDDENNVPAIDTEDPSASATEGAESIILDPKNSERRYYFDPYTKLQREIWRPGWFSKMTQLHNPAANFEYPRRWRWRQVHRLLRKA